MANDRGVPDIAWHGTTLNSPGFDDPGGRALACTIAGTADSADLHVMMNMFWEPLDFEVPTYTRWRVAIDTHAASPDDIADVGTPFSGLRRTVQGRGIVVLESRAH
jgi:glycogen operon protein